MSTPLNIQRIRQVLNKKDWFVPTPWGSDGWLIKSKHKGQIIVTCADYEGVDWIHASISRVSQMPTYDDLKLLHKACFDDGFAYQVFVPSEKHVNFHEYALHLWGRLDGKPVLPDFGKLHEQWTGLKMV